jgi:hypothetical protein
MDEFKWLIETCFLCNDAKTSVHTDTDSGSKLLLGLLDLSRHPMAANFSCMHVTLLMRVRLLLLLHRQQTQAAVAPAAAVHQLQQTKLGVALYMRASVLNHSCAPTAAVRFEGRTIVVAATEPLAKGDPIEVSHSYYNNRNCYSLTRYLSLLRFFAVVLPLTLLVVLLKCYCFYLQYSSIVHNSIRPTVSIMSTTLREIIIAACAMCTCCYYSKATLPLRKHRHCC